MKLWDADARAQRVDELLGRAPVAWRVWAPMTSV